MRPHTAPWRWLAVATVAAYALALSSAVVHTQGRRPAAPAATAPRDPCASPANKIIAENCKPGNDSTEWDVNAHGDPTILGFATEMSVLPGQTINFKINSPSTKYRIDIFRMGYYAGDGGRRVMSLSSVKGMAQPDPPVGKNRVREAAGRGAPRSRSRRTG